MRLEAPGWREIVKKDVAYDGLSAERRSIRNERIVGGGVV